MIADPCCQAEFLEDGRLLRLTLRNGPSNEITPGLLSAIGRSLDDLEERPGVNCVILTSAGSAFSKGFDVRIIEEYQTTAAHRRDLLVGNDVCSRIAASRVPWIAAINGHCLGGGLELALACHFRLGLQGARFGLPELSRGLLPGLGGMHRLTRLIGRARALDLILSGDLVNGDEAFRIGLITRLVPKATFDDAVLSFARNLASIDSSLVTDVMDITALAEQGGDQDALVETTDRVLNHWQPKICS